MALYDDLLSASAQGISQTASDFWIRAKDKFVDRVVNKKKPTRIERNVGAAFAETQSGQLAQSEYIERKIGEYMRNPLTWIVVVSIFGLFFMLRSRG